MKLTITEIFSCISKLLPAYQRLAAVVLKLEGDKFSVGGVARDRNFGFTAEVENPGVGDFTITVAPDDLARALKLSIKKIQVSKNSLQLFGTLGNAEGAPLLEVTCDAVSEAMATDVGKIHNMVLERIGELDTDKPLCVLSDVLKPWEAVAKCGMRLFITEDLTYSMSASSNAFFVKEGVCENIPDTEEPLQVDSHFVQALAAVQQAFNGAVFKIYTVNDGKNFIVLSADKDIFLVEGASIPPEKRTLPRIQSRLADIQKFDKITLPQSALRDLLQTAADRGEVEIRSEEGYLDIQAGAFGKIIVDTADFDCQCCAYREHTVSALNALPAGAEMLLGFGESGGRTFLSMTSGDVTIIIPVHDITEVE